MGTLVLSLSLTLSLLSFTFDAGEHQTHCTDRQNRTFVHSVPVVDVFFLVVLLAFGCGMSRRKSLTD